MNVKWQSLHCFTDDCRRWLLCLSADVLLHSQRRFDSIASSDLLPGRIFIPLLVQFGYFSLFSVFAFFRKGFLFAVEDELLCVTPFWDMPGLWHLADVIIRFYICIFHRSKKWQQSACGHHDWFFAQFSTLRGRSTDSFLDLGFCLNGSKVSQCSVK